MRYNLIAPRPKKDGGTWWHKVGSAFPRDKGGFSLVFDSLPLPDDKGRVTLLMTEDDQERRQPPREERVDHNAIGSRRDERHSRADMDDDIGF